MKTLSIENIRKAARGEGGFTLIELLVTVTVIGILAAVVSVGVGGASTTAQSKANAGKFNQVQAAADAFTASGNTITTTANAGGPPQNVQVTICTGEVGAGANKCTAANYYGVDGLTAPTVAQTDYYVDLVATNQLTTGSWIRLHGSSAFTCLFKGSGGAPTNTVLGCKNATP